MKKMISSCSGCRVLRMGCKPKCVIRPCLDWIGSAQSQANATFFLAKFFGRAGLFNLLGCAPLALRPAIFKSLLYEACGRIINPIYGAVGLMMSDNWKILESTVRAVLYGISVGNVHSHLAPYLTPAPLLQQDCVRRSTTTRAPEPRVSTARARLKRPAEAVPEADRRKRPFWGKNVVGQGEAGTSGTKGAKEVELDLNLSLKLPSSSS